MKGTIRAMRECDNDEISIEVEREKVKDKKKNELYSPSSTVQIPASEAGAFKIGDSVEVKIVPTMEQKKNNVRERIGKSLKKEKK